MKILYVASEASPYAASGGLADVMGALPTAVSELDVNNEVSLIMPLYTNKIAKEYRDKMVKVRDITFKLSWRDTGATVYKLKNGGVTVYFIENHYYFDRGALYGEYDDGERFAFFSMAVVEFMLAEGYTPDILNANDWQSAMTVVYLKTRYKGFKALSAIKTVYTIHNIEYQGKFDPYILGDVFALDNEYLGALEYDGCLNLMKGAIILSDYVSTVSPNYAAELRHDFFAFGLASIIAENSHKLTGIINGIDYGYFSPTVKDIPFTYTKRTVRSGKAKNKAELCKRLGLSTDENIPLVAMITRLASQKGIDLVLHVAGEMLSRGLQFVLLGTGEPEYEAAFAALERRFPNFRAILKFDRATSKLIYAAADIFLMPSKSEPCGLSQMISCAYGTVPVVRSVGGLYDSIIPYPAEGANGFRFDNYNAHDMLGALDYALAVYKDGEIWHALRKCAVNSDFTWGKSAAKYLALYNNLLK